MNTISTNPTPLMTDYLVNSVKAFETDPFIILDVGARGGYNSEWQVFGNQCRIFCFEPDEKECERLNAQAPSHVKYIPRAIGGKSGPATLYETTHPAGTGLFKADVSYISRLLNGGNNVVVAEHRIQVSSLEDVLADYNIPTVNFIKLDAEGAEFDVLDNASRHIEAGALLGLLSEVRFQREINGSPPFAILDTRLQAAGLRLYGIQSFHQTRKALPYPGLQDYRLPTGEQFFAYTTRGQIQDGDALYFRDLLIDANRHARAELSPRELLKLCAIFEIYSLNDCAAELIVESQNELSSIVDCDILLDLLASGISGREIGYATYVRKYFSRAQALDSLATNVAHQELSATPVSGQFSDSTIRILRALLDACPAWMSRPIYRIGRSVIRAIFSLRRRLNGGGSRA